MEALKTLGILLWTFGIRGIVGQSGGVVNLGGPFLAKPGNPWKSLDAILDPIRLAERALQARLRTPSRIAIGGPTTQGAVGRVTTLRRAAYLPAPEIPRV